MGSDGSEKKLDLSSAATAPSMLSSDPPVTAADSDAEILGALRRGDHREALALCARFHGRSVGRLCMALLGSSSEADDALQETLLAAHSSFASFRGDGSLKAWLLSIARRRCARVLERRVTQPNVERRAAEETPPDSGSREQADALVDARRRAEAARALLARVRPTEREALLLRYEAGLSYREVGEACGVDETAARKRVSRALARLREFVKE
jgi:RNA polymerase sigma-70 factor (ECF subfamily)